MLQISCHTRFVQVDVSGGDGMESAARDMRYDALQELAVQADLHHILLAHHQNDQAETVLLRLLRGAGPIGLAAMAPVMPRQGLSYVCPWLEVDRALVLQQEDIFATINRKS